MPDSPAPNAPEAVDYMITQSLTRWEERSESEKRSNVLKAVGDRYWEAMFGYLMAAGDVRIWQNRLDWAALTHTAYRLPGIGGL